MDIKELSPQFTRKMMPLIVDERYKIVRHLILSFGVLLMIACSDDIWKYPGIYGFYKLFCIYFALMLLCYVNMKILVPVFFFRGRYLSYLAIMVVMVTTCLSIVSNIMHKINVHAAVIFHDDNVYRINGLYQGTITIIPIILVTSMIMLLQRWVRDSESLAELRNVTLRMELDGLRNQINPHFLFNMLNGIKALVRNEPEKAAVVITKLSEFLRYQLYEHDEQKIMLKSELNFLTNFLDLEKLRRDNLQVEITVSSGMNSIKGIFIQPNLFTTFLENAVKHSVNIDGDLSYIKVDFNIENHKLIFTATNSRDARFKARRGKNSGVGLSNIKRRLELLFPNQHHLEFKINERSYKVLLEINI